jgi:hypothetical protein
MIISEHMTPVMYTDYSGYAPTWLKLGASVAVGVAAFILFPATVTVITAILIAGATYAILNSADEFAKASKLEDELEKDLQAFQNESIKDAYRESAENAIGFRRGFALISGITGVISDPLSATASLFGYDLSIAGNMRDATYNTFENTSMWTMLSVNETLTDDEILRYRNEIRDKYLFD